MLIEIVVIPKSPKFAVIQKGEKTSVRLTEEAEGNRANIELIKELRRLTGSDVKIVSGLKSRRKTIEINIDKNKWEEIIRGFTKKQL